MIQRKQGLIWKTNSNNRIGAYAEDVARKNSEKKKRERKIFTTDFKNQLLRFNKEIKDAIREDKDDKDIIDIMHESLDNYIKENISVAEYEDVLKSYAYEIPKENRNALYPDIQSIEKDFKTKMSQKIQIYGRGWIDDIRIKTILNSSPINTIISSKFKNNFLKGQILDYIIEANPNIEKMPNLKNALIRRIDKEVENRKNDLSQQQGEQ